MMLQMGEEGDSHELRDRRDGGRVIATRRHFWRLLATYLFFAMSGAILRSGLPPPRWKRTSKFQISNKSRSTLECSLGR